MDREKLRTLVAQRRSRKGATPSCKDVAASDSEDVASAPAQAPFSLGVDAGPSSTSRGQSRGNCRGQGRMPDSRAGTQQSMGSLFPILHRRDFDELDQDMQNRVMRRLGARTANEKKERQLAIWLWRAARGRECILRGDLRTAYENYGLTPERLEQLDAAFSNDRHGVWWEQCVLDSCAQTLSPGLSRLDSLAPTLSLTRASTSRSIARYPD